MNPLKILIVENDETLRYLAKRQLTTCGFGCDLAEDGEEAVAKATQTKYAMILMDIQMPNMSGVQATEEIRRHEASIGCEAFTPIVAMTANPNKSDCLKAGMDDFIFKPVLLGDLEQILKRWLSVMPSK
jgi:CheY-like chemotaxis protein